MAKYFSYLKRDKLFNILLKVNDRFLSIAGYEISKYVLIINLK